MHAGTRTLLVVVVVALAGCTGGLFGGGPTDGTDGTDGAASTATGTTVERTPTFEVADAERRLSSAGSFTATLTLNVSETGGETTRIEDRYRVDLRENRSLETFAMTGPSAAPDFETFYADGTTYTRYGSGSEAVYRVQDERRDLFEQALARGTFSYGAIDNVTYAGTESYDGVTVERYEYSGTELWSEVGGQQFQEDTNITVTAFSLTVLLDEDGLPRKTAWSLTGETADGGTLTAEWAYTLTGVGSTTVEDPAWLDEARAQQTESARLEGPSLAAE